MPIARLRALFPLNLGVEIRRRLTLLIVVRVVPRILVVVRARVLHFRLGKYIGRLLVLQP